MSIETPTGASAIRLTRRHLLAASAAMSTAIAMGHSGQAAAHHPAAARTAPAGLWPDAVAIPATVDADASVRFSAVVDALKEAMVTNGIPGAALGILMDGQEEHAALGVANLETGETVTPETRFQIGSVTKSHTGTAIMRLIGDGKLDLYAPVRTYLPDFQLQDEDVAARVTVYNLLTHTSGWWGDAFVDTGDGDDALARYVQEWLPTLPQIAPLGAFPNYNNAAIAVLGRLIAVVEGMGYRTALRNLLLDPLGMERTTLDPAEVERGPHALGYASTATGTVLQSPLSFPRNMDAVGNIWSTTRDQLRYARFHIADGVAPDGTALIPAHTVRLMRAAHEAFAGNPIVRMGLIWWVQEIGGIRIAMHTGENFGQRTTFLMAPELGFAVILLANAQPGGGAAESAILPIIAREYLGLDAEAAQLGTNGGFSFAADATPLPLSAAERAAYAGRFETPISAITLRESGDHLLFTMETLERADQISESVSGPLPKDVPVSVISGDRLAAGTFQIGAFGRYPDGRIGWFRMSVLSWKRVGDD